MKRIIFSLVVALAASVSSLFAQVREIPFGNMEKWLVREVDESLIIGGKTRYLYEVAPGDTLKENTPFVPNLKQYSFNTIHLEEPLKIDEGKNLRVAVYIEQNEITVPL